MKQVKTIFMVLIMILICCSYSNGQSSSEIGIKGNVGAAPIGIIDNGASVYPVGEYGASVYPVGGSGASVYPVGGSGASVYPVGEYGASVYPVGKYGASFWLREFVCNSMSACGMYDPARASDGAIVGLDGVKRVKP